MLLPFVSVVVIRNVSNFESFCCMFVPVVGFTLQGATVVVNCRVAYIVLPLCERHGNRYLSSQPVS